MSEEEKDNVNNGDAFVCIIITIIKTTYNLQFSSRKLLWVAFDKTSEEEKQCK